jgi:hypothetical protein
VTDAHIWSIADRFKFQPSEIWRMKRSEYEFWYEGAQALSDHEKAQMEAVK